MKVRVDMELCESNALCVAACPEVFELDDHDQLIVLIERPGEELREQLETAAQLCPRLAITVTDD